MTANYNVEPLLEVDGLEQYFQVNRTYAIRAVDDVSFKVWSGETYSLTGESGSGRSTIGRTIIHPYNPTAEAVQFNGTDISGKMSRQTKKSLRRQMQIILQDPIASLNPRKTMGDIIGEGLDVHHSCRSAGEREVRIEAMLRKVGLDPEHHSHYPHQFSGEQRQRVSIARAFMMNPKLIIANGCISALGVLIRAQIVNLMKDIQEETGTAYPFITHDLTMVKYISDRIGVLHLGYLLGTGSKDEIFSYPIHPYARSLLSIILVPNPVVGKQRIAEIYDCRTSGIDYNKGANHLVEDTHHVRCTDQEFEKRVGAASHTRLFGTNQLYWNKCVRR